MHPSNYFGLFPAFPRDQRVFVAMSFAPEFDKRWNDVIAPAVRQVQPEGSLEPHRVDMRQVSDSILTEILDGIGRCRLVIGDISTIGYVDGRAARNANVLYEVGLAHATRLPEEVLLVRSDDDPLNFDVSNVRVHRYQPDESPVEARTLLVNVIAESLKEVDLKKSLAVRRAASSLDASAWTVLLNSDGGNAVPHPAGTTMGEILGGSRYVQAIQALLERGAIETQFVKQTAESMALDPSIDQTIRYKITPLGQAIVGYGLAEMNMYSREVMEAVLQARARKADAESSA